MSNVFPLEAGESPTHHSIPGLPQGVIVLQGLPQCGENSAWTLWERESRHRHSAASFPVLHSICHLWCKLNAKSTSDKCYKGSGTRPGTTGALWLWRTTCAAGGDVSPCNHKEKMKAKSDCIRHSTISHTSSFGWCCRTPLVNMSYNPWTFRSEKTVVYY